MEVLMTIAIGLSLFSPPPRLGPVCGSARDVVATPMIDSNRSGLDWSSAEVAVMGHVFGISIQALPLPLFRPRTRRLKLAKAFR